MQENTATRLGFAVAIAQSAGHNILNYFQQSNFHVEQKKDTTPVTEADKTTELILRTQIMEAFPEDAILGEEFPSKEGTSGYRWILDPIDGTKSFIHGVPLFGTLIAVELNGECVIGVIRIPALDEMVFAAKGNGAWYVHGETNPVPAHVSQTETLEEATVLTTSDRTYARVGCPEAWQKITEATQLTRMWGDCYGYLLVATGRVDAMVDPEMSIWDVAALYPIIQEAGGQISAWSGAVDHTASNTVASNGLLHEQLLALL